ncbi:MAG: Gldg family protein [Leptolyngbyaceae bacterium]|nr:Gldg family protein [Leptolyngbyaceae bacterium]
MKQSAITPYLKSLVWISPILMIVGVTLGLALGSWDVWPLVFLLGGVLVLTLWLVSQSNALPGFFGRRSTQASTNVLVSTLAMVFILGLINFLAVKWPQQIDLTENQLFTLAPQTQQVLRELDEPVELFFFRTDEFRPAPVEQDLLDKYRRQSSQFNYTVVDPQADPALTQRFGVQNPAGEIHLESGARRQLVQVLNPQQPLTEVDLTNGIVNLFSDRQTTVYFLQGHGEFPLEPGQGGLADAQSLLVAENYRVETLNLAQEPAVPDDADVVIIAGAQQALFEGEVQALQSYLSTSSGLLVLLDPQGNPGLDDLFADWGIEPLDRLIIDPNGQAVGADVTTTLVQTYGEHPITESFGNNYSFYPITQPLNLDVQEDIESAPLLISSDVTQALPVPQENDPEFEDFNENDVINGPLVFGVALNRPAIEPSPSPQDLNLDAISEEEASSSDADADDNNSEVSGDEAESEAESEAETDTDEANPSEEESEAEEETEEAAESPDEARLVVIGNANFVSNGLVNQQLNGDVFLNTVNWLSQQTNQPLAIRPKSVDNRRIVLDGLTLATIALTAIAILPIIGFGGAIFLWLRRR